MATILLPVYTHQNVSCVLTENQPVDPQSSPLSSTAKKFNQSRLSPITGGGYFVLVIIKGIVHRASRFGSQDVLFVKSLYHIYHSIYFYSTLVAHIRGKVFVGLFLPLSQEIIIFNPDAYKGLHRTRSSALHIKDTDNSIKSLARLLSTTERCPWC